MVAKIRQKTEHQQLLIDGLHQLPETWALTPVKGNKACYRTQWQFEEPLSHQWLIAEIKSDRAKGYGLRTGSVSGGIVAIDADGHAAHDKINELSGGEALPETVAFTSNKSGRCQYLFYIPQEYWDAISTKKIGTGIKGEDGKEQKLELRWDGCQSVLPPSEHPETGGYRWVKSPEYTVIAPAPMWVIEKMLAEPEPQQSERYPTSCTRKLRTGKDWTSKDWALSYLSALNPNRADDYDYWIKTGMGLHEVDDSLLPEWDNWSSQSSKYKPGECEKKWKSFKRSGIAIGTLAHMAKEDGWQSPFETASTGRGFSGGSGGNRRNFSNGGGSGDGGNGGDGGDGDGKVIKHPSFQSISPEELATRLDALIQEGLSGADLTNRLNHLAQETGRHVIELRKQYSERLLEIEREEGREDTQSQVDSLIDASRASIDLRKVLPSSLAERLLELAGWLNLKSECSLTALITTSSTLHKVGTKVVLNKEWGFEVTPNLYSAIIAPSSQKKSPIIKSICTKPLKLLQQEALKEYKHQLQLYQEELKEWETTKPEDRGEPPVKPERKIYFFTKTTGEGLTYQAARYPEQGMLYLTDELAGMLNAQNQYRGGKGSDKQDLLSHYDGTGDVVLRAEGVKSEVDCISLGILGGIQPKVMQKLLGSCDDPDGGWARFIFVNQPLSASKMSADGGSYDLTELLTGLYRKIDELPRTEYRLSPKAFRLFCKAYNRLEKLRVNDRLEGMQSVWGKSEGRIGKLAVNLHVIHALMKGEIPSQEIPEEIIEIAIKLTDFYAQQVQSLYTQFADPDALAPQLAKVIELYHKKKGWLKASDVYLSITKKQRPSGETVREWFGELVVMGKGEVRGQGRSLQFRAFLLNEKPPTPPPNTTLDGIRQELDESSNAEMTTYQEVQEKLDKLDDLDDFPKNESIQQNVVIQDESLNNIDSQAEEEKVTVLSNSSNLSNEAQKQDTVLIPGLDNASNVLSNLSNFDADALSTPATEESVASQRTSGHSETLDEAAISEAVEVAISSATWEELQEVVGAYEFDESHLREMAQRLIQSDEVKFRPLLAEYRAKQFDGQTFRYVGEMWRIQWFAKAKPLTIEAIDEEGTATVSSSQWHEDSRHSIPFSDLKIIN